MSNNTAAEWDDRKQAYDNLLAAIDFKKFLPDYVFKQDFEVMLFFFGCVETLLTLMDPLYEIEGSSSICLLQLSVLDDYDFDRRGLTFPCKNMDSKSVRSGLQSFSLTFGIDTFGCMSNIGEWCMYLDTKEDIAIFALRTKELREKYQSVIKKIYADLIVNLMRPEPIGRSPFNQYVPEWKESLTKHYGHVKAV